MARQKCFPGGEPSHSVRRSVRPGISKDGGGCLPSCVRSSVEVILRYYHHYDEFRRGDESYGQTTDTVFFVVYE